LCGLALLARDVLGAVGLVKNDHSTVDAVAALANSGIGDELYAFQSVVGQVTLYLIHQVFVQCDVENLLDASRLQLADQSTKNVGLSGARLVCQKEQSSLFLESADAKRYVLDLLVYDVLGDVVLEAETD